MSDELKKLYPKNFGGASKDGEFVDLIVDCENGDDESICLSMSWEVAQSLREQLQLLLGEMVISARLVKDSEVTLEGNADDITTLLHAIDETAEIETVD